MALDLTKTKGTKASQDDRHEICWGRRRSTIRSRGVRGVGSCDAARTTGFESCIRQAEAFGICRAFCVSAQNFFGKCQANIFQRHQFSAASFQFSVSSSSPFSEAQFFPICDCWPLLLFSPVATLHNWYTLLCISPGFWV